MKIHILLKLSIPATFSVTLLCISFTLAPFFFFHRLGFDSFLICDEITNGQFCSGLISEGLHHSDVSIGFNLSVYIFNKIRYAIDWQNECVPVCWCWIKCPNGIPRISVILPIPNNQEASTNWVQKNNKLCSFLSSLFFYVSSTLRGSDNQQI